MTEKQFCNLRPNDIVQWESENAKARGVVITTESFRSGYHNVHVEWCDGLGNLQLDTTPDNLEEVLSHLTKVGRASPPE